MSRFAIILSLVLFVSPPVFAADPLEGQSLGKTPDFEYVDMAPIVLPIITEKGVTQQVSIVISLEVPYGKTGPVKAMTPKLTDAYLSDLYAAMGSGVGLKKGSIVNVPVIKERLTKNTVKVLGPDVVHDVLIQVVQQTPR